MSIMLVSVFVLFMCLVQMIRLSFLSKFLDSEIERVYRTRITMIHSHDYTYKKIKYPNIKATYTNFNWSIFIPWKTPSQLIVYDKDDA